MAPSIVLSWYHHQPESHQQSLNQSLGCMYIETPGPIDRTPETPGSGKKDKTVRERKRRQVRKCLYLQPWRDADWVRNAGLAVTRPQTQNKVFCKLWRLSIGLAFDKVKTSFNRLCMLLLM